MVARPEQYMKIIVRTPVEMSPAIKLVTTLVPSVPLSKIVNSVDMNIINIVSRFNSGIKTLDGLIFESNSSNSANRI